MGKNIYVLGNPLEPDDRPAVKLIPQLKKKFPQINFIRFDPTEEFPQNNKELIIIDTVAGIADVKKFDDLNRWVMSPRVTVHDYDLPLTLGLLKKLGKIKKFTIIGIPQKGKKEKILEEINQILTSL